MKIPFDIKFRPQIESGEYKVFAHEHEEQEARIVCWDNKGEYPIIALVDNEPEKFDKHGRIPGGNRGGEFSLFLVTPEPELSGFEKELESFYNHHLQVCTYDNQGTVEDSLHDWASKLLAIAKKELLSEKMLIGQTYNPDINKAHELGRKEGIMLGKSEALKEIEQDPESSYAFKRGVEYGKEEALNDLPRWRKWEGGACGNSDGHPIALVSGVGGIRFVSAFCVTGEKYIMLDDLKKLPGFNE